MSKEKNLRIRITLSQHNKLYLYANSRMIDVSQVIRNLIDELGNDEGQIKKQIEYYKYMVTTAEWDLESLKRKNGAEALQKRLEENKGKRGVIIYEK